ncbi:MAG: hypothetical protein KY437_09485, partial [Actinobacteria bacterium]|nr:hypothetical protein [Actinomycetota bacterium]
EEQAELERRIQRYRGGRAPSDVAGKSAVVVDDGLATGVTARAAVQSVRVRDPARVVLAVPTGAPATATAFEDLVDDGELLGIDGPAGVDRPRLTQVGLEESARGPGEARCCSGGRGRRRVGRGRARLGRAGGEHQEQRGHQREGGPRSSHAGTSGGRRSGPAARGGSRARPS